MRSSTKVRVLLLFATFLWFVLLVATAWRQGALELVVAPTTLGLWRDIPLSTTVKKDTSTSTFEFSCAPNLAKEKRKILFIHLPTMATYKSTGSAHELGSKTGEFYEAAAWDYVLQERLGFQVTNVTQDEFGKMEIQELSQYHRIILGCLYANYTDLCFKKWSRQKHFDVGSRLYPLKCKVRVFFVWEHGPDVLPGFFGDGYFHPRQVLSPYTMYSNNGINTPMGYFPHNILDTPNVPSLDQPPPSPRGKVGIIIGKRPDRMFDETAIRAMQMLLDDGYTLHATCRAADCSKLPQGVQNHHSLTPAEHAELMTQVAFIIGFGKPRMSPSPLIALSTGVPFIMTRPRQHPPLLQVGPPYVFSVNMASDPKELLRVAEYCATNPIAPYVPPEFTVESVVDNVCVMVEDESPCQE